MSDTILIVDNDSTCRTILTLSLQSSGWEIINAQCGSDALDLLEKTPFDLVVTDLQTPKMNGIDIIKEIRTLPQHANTSIVILTTETGELLKIEARTVGATAWIEKVFEIDELLALVKKALSIRSAASLTQSLSPSIDKKQDIHLL